MTNPNLQEIIHYKNFLFCSFPFLLFFFFFFFSTSQLRGTWALGIMGKPQGVHFTASGCSVWNLETVQDRVSWEKKTSQAALLRESKGLEGEGEFRHMDVRENQARSGDKGRNERCGQNPSSLFICRCGQGEPLCPYLLEELCGAIREKWDTNPGGATQSTNGGHYYAEPRVWS